MSDNQPIGLGTSKLQVIPDTPQVKPALAEQPTVGWHFHRWTAWEEGRVWNIDWDGSRVPVGVQHKQCTKCRKIKLRQYLKKVRPR
jgi:hypothetical protein